MEEHCTFLATFYIYMVCGKIRCTLQSADFYNFFESNLKEFQAALISFDTIKICRYGRPYRSFPPAVLVASTFSSCCRTFSLKSKKLQTRRNIKITIRLKNKVRHLPPPPSWMQLSTKSLSRLNKMLKFIDIGANLTDSMFCGVYGGKEKHPNDRPQVLKRAWQQGMQKMIITVGTVNEADEALHLAKTDERLFVTIGCHPTRSKEFLPNPEEYYESLRQKISNNRDKVVAIGECGLDYDRLHFSDKETQKIYFEKQLNLAAEFKLPLFLHCRNSHEDFMEILNRNKDKLEVCGGGVVHSFDGSLEEANKVLENKSLYIGLNGCSLKTKDNLSVIREIPNNRLMIETDCPWCSIKPSHAGFSYIKTKFPTVKKKEKWTEGSLIDGRCEPCQIAQVLEVIAGAKEEPKEHLAEIFYQNSMDLYFEGRENMEKC